MARGGVSFVFDIFCILSADVFREVGCPSNKLFVINLTKHKLDNIQLAFAAVYIECTTV